MKTFGLLGFPLAHSFSKSFFESKFKILGLKDCEFLLFEYSDIKDFINVIPQIKYLKGFSVTSPHKENIIPFLDDIDVDANDIDAVNCVKVIEENGQRKMIGYNTDHYGFHQSLKPFLEPKHSRALILGTGGAAKAVAFSLKKLGLEYWFVTRVKNKNVHAGNLFEYSELSPLIIDSFKLIVNTTPSEMLYGPQAFPKIPYEYISTDHLCYDLIYQPEETRFLINCKSRGAVVMNGLDMLYAQAEKAWSIWTK
ncbi:MAG: shikimate dehydrogenase family protein [Bacteroidota bacterium]